MLSVTVPKYFNKVPSTEAYYYSKTFNYTQLSPNCILFTNRIVMLIYTISYRVVIYYTISSL